MPLSEEMLFARLDALSIAYATREHRAVFTVAESMDLRGEIPGAHTKNLLLKDKKGALFLVTAEELSTVDLKNLHKALGCGRLSFASAERLMQHLGVTPGSVTALAIAGDTDGAVTFVLDRRIVESETVNCHPLRNTATTSLASADLVRFARACGHEPVIIDVENPLASAISSPE